MIQINWLTGHYAMPEIKWHLKILVTTFLKYKCMHKNCLLDKAVDLSTIYWEMNCFLSKIYISHSKIPRLKKYLGSSHREIPWLKNIYK